MIDPLNKITWEPMQWVVIPLRDGTIAFSWSKTWKVVDIDGMHSVEELEAIVQWMKQQDE